MAIIADLRGERKEPATTSRAISRCMSRMFERLITNRMWIDQLPIMHYPVGLGQQKMGSSANLVLAAIVSSGLLITVGCEKGLAPEVALSPAEALSLLQSWARSSPQTESLDLRSVHFDPDADSDNQLAAYKARSEYECHRELQEEGLAEPILGRRSTDGRYRSFGIELTDKVSPFITRVLVPRTFARAQVEDRIAFVAVVERKVIRLTTRIYPWAGAGRGGFDADVAARVGFSWVYEATPFADTCVAEESYAYHDTHEGTALFIRQIYEGVGGEPFETRWILENVRPDEPFQAF